MADEFGGTGSDFSASTPQTNTISTSQPNVDSVESSQSVLNTPANTNTSASSENRSEGLQTRESGNQQIIAAAKNSEGTQGYVLVKGEDGKTHLKPSPLTEPPKNEEVAQEPNMFGADANWGRVICALGSSGVDFDPKLVDISFKSNDEIVCCECGKGLDFDEEKAKDILLQEEIEIVCDMHSGSESCTCWGCDLTYDYVKINAEYTT